MLGVGMGTVSLSVDRAARARWTRPRIRFYFPARVDDELKGLFLLEVCMKALLGGSVGARWASEDSLGIEIIYCRSKDAQRLVFLVGKLTLPLSERGAREWRSDAGQIFICGNSGRWMRQGWHPPQESHSIVLPSKRPTPRRDDTASIRPWLCHCTGANLLGRWRVFSSQATAAGIARHFWRRGESARRVEPSIRSIARPSLQSLPGASECDWHDILDLGSSTAEAPPLSL